MRLKNAVMTATMTVAARSPMLRGIWASVIAGVCALLTVGVTPALAQSISHRPEGIRDYEVIADNFWGERESETPYYEPPGDYVDGVGGGGDGVYEYTEECEHGNVFEHCEGLHTVVDQDSEGTLPPGFVKSKHLELVTEFEGYRTVVEYRYAWSPDSKLFGEGNPGEPERKGCRKGHPINCATGNQVATQTDLEVGGRGPKLQLALTYNSFLAATQTTAGPFGLGWTASYSAHLEVNGAGTEATVYQDNGSTVTFMRSGEAWTPTSSLAQATLATAGSGYVNTLPNQTALHFSSSGALTSEVDRNGNTLTMNRSTEGRLESISDGAGRKITLTYNSEGRVESAKDPMGHTVKYTYESGNLASVTHAGEEKPRYSYSYNEAHELTSETDGREHAITTEYSDFQAIAQSDSLSGTRAWHYALEGSGIETTITEPNGSLTLETFNSTDQPTVVIRAAGTPYATTTHYKYNSANEMTGITDPDKHTTEYGYDEAGNRTSETDANGGETKWKYDSTHDVETETTPKGETTTIKRDAHGNPEVIERPAPGSTTQKTTYKVASNGDVESMTDPLEHTWKYEYNTNGDRKSETDPEGNKRTWEYNEDSQETATVSPRGNVTGGKPAEFTTKTERDAQGRPLTITDPLSHKTKYTYDGDGNVETDTDANGHKTKYTYDADNELTKTEEPNKTLTETEYDAMGQVKGQTDGNKHASKYVRNLLGEVTEVIDPKERKTTKEYDGAGNLTSLTDAAKRTTTYTYDPGNRLKEVTYSDGKTPTVKYEYDADGDTTKMTDGTGTSTNTYDQLDRLTEQKDGHGDTVKNEYNLANGRTAPTYPNTKSVSYAYDKDERLEKTTDWLGSVTKYTYNPDSNQATTLFPSASKDEDKYAYNDADSMTEAKMLKGSETLASLVYTRDSDGQLKKTTAKKLPGTEITEATYDENNRLTQFGSTAFEYDAANNATKRGTGAYKYDQADQLETGPSLTYTYNEVGQRTKTKPSSGPTTTYGYDQAGNLTSVERPKEGEVTKIEDSYGYDGSGIRASQTISATTTYLTWDLAGPQPVILSDGSNSYIYGPGNMPVEQISSTGTVTYLHHDQQGSTRLITSSTGTATGKCTYGAYGAPNCEGAATTPLGYDAQYTSTDTGLIYMRARVYDPGTGQFLTVDPIAAITRARYSYAIDNPVNYLDPTGLCSIVPGSSDNCFSETPGAIISGVESVAQNPGATVGVILGGVAVATGVGEVVVGGTAVAEGTLGTISVVSGAGAAGVDAKACAAGSGAGCVGAGLGAVASGGAGVVALGGVSGTVAAGTTAISISTGAIGFFGDAAAALGSPSSSSTPSGCG